jgi:hypothetical protein
MVPLRQVASLKNAGIARLRGIRRHDATQCDTPVTQKLRSLKIHGIIAKLPLERVRKKPIE